MVAEKERTVAQVISLKLSEFYTYPSLQHLWRDGPNKEYKDHILLQSTNSSKETGITFQREANGRVVGEIFISWALMEPTYNMGVNLEQKDKALGTVVIENADLGKLLKLQSKGSLRHMELGQMNEILRK